MPRKIVKSEESILTLLTRITINVAALLTVGYLLPGFTLRDLGAAFVAAVVIGLVNTYIRPIFQLVALPITIVTFGIGAFIVNVLLLWISSLIVPGFEIDNFITAAIASILLMLISWFLHGLARTK